MIRRYAAVTDQTLRAAAEAVSGAEAHEGRAFRSTYQPKKSKPLGGHTGPATVPVEPYDGFKIDKWSGRVFATLKRMKPPALAKYFMSCDLSMPPLQRLECWLERLERIMTQVQRKY
jgi:hypothetical protein